MLGRVEWATIIESSAEEGAEFLTKVTLRIAEKCIKKKTLVEQKSSHPWLNERVLATVTAMRTAAGTLEEGVKAAECSKVVLQEYDAWCKKVKKELLDMKPGSKAWWAKEKQLQQQRQKQCSIPALKDADCTWQLEPAGKANLLAKSFGDKFSLPAAETNAYSQVDDVSLNWSDLPVLSVEAAEKTLRALSGDSATGPDVLPTRILKRCAQVLALPV